MPLNLVTTRSQWRSCSLLWRSIFECSSCIVKYRSWRGFAGRINSSDSAFTSPHKTRSPPPQWCPWVIRTMERLGSLLAHSRRDTADELTKFQFSGRGRGRRFSTNRSYRKKMVALNSSSLYKWENEIHEWIHRITQLILLDCRTRGDNEVIRPIRVAGLIKAGQQHPSVCRLTYEIGWEVLGKVRVE